ncbi:response regulator receiver domain-containing protein [Paractinoplanes brasiliensis]|uniref:Response regulator receiver domain-containing protein n=1 Tax=Paractinoplanes brasiliensis TaxID=52695 RepID=A0A4V3C617_9ACTN|nr:response regulator receiver domain-containing protein [Actinoplanes brasiliensis]GID28022.1 hypothetical protein Abr02nite_30050 [Actinoplanes brasiliensis]
MTTPIRIVIADDHFVAREGLRSSFKAVAEVTVVGEATNGRELLAVVNHHRPDVVLTDIQMPGLDGIAATELLLAHHPGLGVLILTEYLDDARVEGALAAGARGYLHKREPSGTTSSAPSSTSPAAALSTTRRWPNASAVSSPALDVSPWLACFLNSPPASVRSSSWSPAAVVTVRSRADSASPRRPYATTCQPS